MEHSIEKIVRKYKNTDYYTIIDELNKEAFRLKQLRSINYEQKEYLNAIKEVLFFFNTLIKPKALDKNSFLAMKPLVQSLLDKKQLKKEVMDCFDNLSQ